MKELQVYQDDLGEWIVTSDKMPGFLARGKTQKEAVEKMRQAFSVYYPCDSGNCKDSQ
jgi:predicted RNase H-like HicB family nuclease